MAHIIIGTAGHIDHGKSALIVALTGTNPDRLTEEQQRGMTIDLGFAFLNKDIAFIDVPGHEKFVKNMVAGVSTVDIAMLVIAADDGVMPQTREHLDILTLLQLERGIVVLTKTDLVDPEWIALVHEDVRELTQGTFLENAPLFKVSSVNGSGIEQLRDAIKHLALETEPRPDRGVFWMPVDRSFSIKGFGTVVTGSVLSGSAQVGDTLELVPQQRTAKIRGLQTHGQATNTIRLGDRAAVNIMNIAKDDVQRGDVLATSGCFSRSKMLDIKLRLLKGAAKPLSNRTRVRAHIGTREIMARVKLLGVEKLEPGSSCFAQLVLEQPVVAMRRDPVVLRRYSPPVTIGGGSILETNPKPHKRFDKQTLEQLQLLEKQNPVELVTAALLKSGQKPVRLSDLADQSGFSKDDVADMISTLATDGTVLEFNPGSKAQYIHASHFDAFQQRVLHTLVDFHKKEPLRPGMLRARLLAQTMKESPKLFDAAIQQLKKNDQIEEFEQSIKLKSHTIRLSEDEQKLAGAIYKSLLDAEYAPPFISDLAKTHNRPPEDIEKLLGALQGLGKIQRFEGDIYFPKDTVQRAKDTLKAHAKYNSEISVSEFREKLQTTRKYAMALLGHFDDIGVTERVGDVRLIQ